MPRNDEFLLFDRLLQNSGPREFGQHLKHQFAYLLTLSPSALALLLRCLVPLGPVLLCQVRPECFADLLQLILLLLLPIYFLLAAMESQGDLLLRELSGGRGVDGDLRKVALVEEGLRRQRRKCWVGRIVGEVGLDARRRRGAMVEGSLSALLRQTTSTDPERLLARIAPVQLDRARLSGHASSSHRQHPRRRIPVRSQCLEPIVLLGGFLLLKLLKELRVCCLLLGP